MPAQLYLTVSSGLANGKNNKLTEQYADECRRAAAMADVEYVDTHTEMTDDKVRQN